MGGCGSPCFVSNTGVSWTMKQGLLASSSEIPGGEFPPQWWPLKRGCGQCVLRLLVNLAIEQPHLLEQPQRSWVQDRIGFYGTLFRRWGSRFFSPTPSRFIPESGWGHLSLWPGSSSYKEMISPLALCFPRAAVPLILELERRWEPWVLNGVLPLIQKLMTKGIDISSCPCAPSYPSAKGRWSYLSYVPGDTERNKRKHIKKFWGTGWCKSSKYPSASQLSMERLGSATQRSFSWRLNLGEGWRAPTPAGRVGRLQADFYHRWTRVSPHSSVVMAASAVGLFLFKLKSKWGELGRGREEPSSFALKLDWTDTLNSSFRAARWGLHKGLSGPRAPLFLPCPLILNFEDLEEGQGNCLVNEGKTIACLCELDKAGVDAQ